MKHVRSLLASVALMASLLPIGAQAQSPPLRTVKIAHGNPVMLTAVFELFVPLSIGWWKAEGLDVQVQFSQGTGAAVQNIIGGGTDIGMGNTTPWLSADVKGLADIRMVATMRNTSWRILAMADRGITKAEDLKGKMVGLAVPGTGGAMYLETILKGVKLDPKRDVRQAVIGVGAQAFDALSTGRVDASLTFMGEIATFRALGNKSVYFYEDAWLDFPDYGLFVTKKLLDQDPALVEKLARGIAKAQVFAEANPECVAKIYRKDYGKGRTLTLEQDTDIQRSNVEEADIAFKRAGGRYRAEVSASGLDKLQNFLRSHDAIPNTIPASNMVPTDPDFFQKINAFDHDAVRAEAKACAGYP